MGFRVNPMRRQRQAQSEIEWNFLRIKGKERFQAGLENALFLSASADNFCFAASAAGFFDDDLTVDPLF